MEVTAHVTLEEGTDSRSGRNRACMKAVSRLTEVYDYFGPTVELVDVTAHKGYATDARDEYGYFEVEVTHVAPSMPHDTEYVTFDQV